jgi:hypothetical protein
MTRACTAAILLALGLVRSAPAEPLELAGTAWVFGSSGLGSDDHSHTIRGKGRPLTGSSCCERFVVAFPTESTFSLRHYSVEIATGRVRRRARSLTLAPDARSRAKLLWWLENELESFWNGPFDRDLNLRLTSSLGQSLRVTLGEGVAERRLQIGLRFQGDLRSIDRTQGPSPAPGRIRGSAAYGASFRGEDEIDDPSPLPPIRPCDDDPPDTSSYRPDYCRR